MMAMRNIVKLALAIPLFAGAATTAQDFEIDWWTVDGGGDMWGYGGDFELSGTIGQPDVGVVMTGGDFELTGGFWVSAIVGPQICRGDLNCDGMIDFGDINPFVQYLSNCAAWQAAYPGCPLENGDINGDGSYCDPPDFGDINPFVALMTGGQGPCP